MDVEVDEAPNFGDSEYPGAGEKIGPFWRSVWRELSDGQEKKASDLAIRHSATAGLLAKTGRNVIQQAQKHGLLKVVYRRRAAWVRRADR